MSTKAFKSLLGMQALLCALFLLSCSNDNNDPLPQPETKKVAVQVVTDTKAGTAVVNVSNAPANAQLQLVYDVKRGEVAAIGNAAENGTHAFKLPLLAGYEQNLKLVVKNGETGAELKGITLPAADEQYTDEQITQGLQGHVWQSVQTRSRILVGHTGTRPYSLFVTQALKRFEFLADSKFTFTVLSPLQKSFPNGTWTVKSKRIDIDTQIPLGPMQLHNTRIQNLTNKELVMLTEVENGLFLLTFEAQ